jgi:tetratricopeptide (TPR) repeat protein
MAAKRAGKTGRRESEKMHRLLIGLTLALIALPAWAQTPQQRDWCASPTATDDQTIDGCNALIQSGQEPPANLSVDYDNRAFAEVNKGLNDQAITDENQSLALNPNNANGYINRGDAYDHKHLYDEAIADFTRAMGLTPNTAAAYNNTGNAFAYNDRGLAYGHKGLYDQAFADYAQAIAISPRFVAPYDNRAALYEKTGSHDQAVANYRTALGIDPNDQEAKNGLARLGAAPKDRGAASA